MNEQDTAEEAPDEEVMETITVEHGDTKVELDDPTAGELLGLAMIVTVVFLIYLIWYRIKTRVE